MGGGGQVPGENTRRRLLLLRAPALRLFAMATPGESLFAGAEAGEITATEFAAVGRGAETKFQDGPAGWIVILLGPGAELQAQTSRAAGITNRGKAPDGGFKTVLALTAAERKNSEQTPEALTESTNPGNAQLFRSALRTEDNGHRQTGTLSSCALCCLT